MKTLFILLALVQLVPVWTPAIFPTEDGGAHVYNAWIMRELTLGHDNRVTRTYDFDLRPHPNWLSHVVLALLLGVASPVVAEKILVSAIILLFLGAVWLFAGTLDAGARVYAFLALPLAHHQLLQFGFYNFCIAVALSLIVVWLWWRRRYVWVAVTLLLCYFAHPLPTAFAVMAIGVEWLMTLRREPFREHAKPLLALVPVVPLLDWYISTVIGKSGVTVWTPWDRIHYLVTTEAIVTFDERQRLIGIGLFAVIALLMIATVIIDPRRRTVHPFLVILLATIAIYMIEPPDAAGGGFVLQRIALIIALVPLPWLTPNLPKPAKIALVAALSIVSIAHAAFLTQRDRQIAVESSALVDAARHIPPEQSFLPLIGDRRPPGVPSIDLLSHTTSYAALERRLVDLDNYEPTTGYFPVKFRRGVTWKDHWDIEQHPDDLDIDTWARFADVIFTWRLRPDAPVFAAIGKRYTLLWSSPDARVYRRRD